MHQQDEPRIAVTFKFYPTGKLKAIFLNVDNSEDQEILERALEKLIRPEKRGWLQRLFTRCK